MKKKTIREYREARGLTQRQLGDLVGVQPQQISNIERGADRPSLTTAIAIARELGVSVSDLFAEEPAR